jgi:hypothetical protein
MERQKRIVLSVILSAPRSSPMTARPIQLSDAAFLMLRKAIGNLDTEVALPVRADGFRRRANARMRQMSEVTYYVALPFVPSDDGIAPGETIECFNPNSAVMKAEALSRKPGHVGAVAFSRSGDPATGDFSDAKLIRKFGDVPEDLSAL